MDGGQGEGGEARHASIRLGRRDTHMRVFMVGARSGGSSGSSSSSSSSSSGSSSGSSGGGGGGSMSCHVMSCHAPI